LLDSLASRYHLLPSEVLRRGDTLDILVLDTALQWHHMKEQEARAKAEGKPMPTKMPVNKLQEMLDSVRQK
jgi:hypothetical protein